MKKIDSTVLKETIYIAVFTFILSVLMQSVFLIIGKWDYTILLGNLLGYIAAVGNFLFLGITIQKAVLKEENDAKYLIKLSQTIRLLAMFAIAIIGYYFHIFNTITVVIPYLFPRIAIALRPYFDKKR